MAKNIQFRKRVRFNDLTTFTRQLAAMVQARISIVHIFDVLERQIENQQLGEVVKRVKAEVQSGKSVADAFAIYPKIFSGFYLNMIRVGEITGELPQMLNRVAAYLEKLNSLKRKLIQSLTYPLLVIIVAVGAVSFLLAFVVPTFADMFKDFDAELPAITVMLLNISNFITGKAWTILIFSTGISVAIYLYLKTGQGVKFKDQFILSMPLAGNLVKKNFISRFARTLSVLIESGIPLLDALKLSEESIPNVVVKKEISQMRYYAEKGEMLTRSMHKSKVFPPMVTQMITVGEETAQLDQMLSTIADFYDDDLESTLTNMTAIMEPAIIIVLGIVIGAILIALYMPLFDMVNIMPG